MTRIAWTPRALDDVLDIRTFIARDSLPYASLTAQRIITAAERLAQFPASGRIVPELDRPEIREVIYGPYRIVYRLLPDAVHILTVHHSARILRLEP